MSKKETGGGGGRDFLKGAILPLCVFPFFPFVHLSCVPTHKWTLLRASLGDGFGAGRLTVRLPVGRLDAFAIRPCNQRGFSLKKKGGQGKRESFFRAK